jgi:hypothetical protein
MSVKMRQEVEKKIVGQFIDDALAAGYRLAVSLERGYDISQMLLGSTDKNKIMEEAFAGDECHIFTQPKNGPTVENNKVISNGWVYCIMGNDGCDVISDYSTNLEKLLVTANKIADQYS